MYSASSPLPLLLLSKVVGDIHEGCYLLLKAHLLRRHWHLRKYLKKTVCRRVQQNLHHSGATLPVLITYTMTVHHSLLERLPRLTPGDWYVVPDDVFIADIEGQALDIFPHSPESAQMTVIVKSYIHSHIHSHSHSKNNLRAKPKTHQT